MPYAWAPSPDDVAAVIPQRPTDATGMAGGTWTTTTVPTAAQVQELIDQRVPEVAASVGTVPESLIELARSVTAVGVASYVELAFYPEQSDTAVGVAQQLWARYQSGLKSLVAGIIRTTAGGGTVPPPLYAFPAAVELPCA